MSDFSHLLPTAPFTFVARPGHPSLNALQSSDCPFMPIPNGFHLGLLTQTPQMRTSTGPITPLEGCSHFQNQKDPAAIRIRKSPREEIHETPAIEETPVWSEPSGFGLEYGVKPNNCDQPKRCSPIYQAGGIMKKPCVPTTTHSGTSRNAHTGQMRSEPWSTMELEPNQLSHEEREYPQLKCPCGDQLVGDKTNALPTSRSGTSTPDRSAALPTHVRDGTTAFPSNFWAVLPAGWPQQQNNLNNIQHTLNSAVPLFKSNMSSNTSLTSTSSGTDRSSEMSLASTSSGADSDHWSRSNSENSAFEQQLREYDLSADLCDDIVDQRVPKGIGSQAWWDINRPIVPILAEPPPELAGIASAKIDFVFGHNSPNNDATADPAMSHEYEESISPYPMSTPANMADLEDEEEESSTATWYSSYLTPSQRSIIDSMYEKLMTGFQTMGCFSGGSCAIQTHGGGNGAESSKASTTSKSQSSQSSNGIKRSYILVRPQDADGRGAGAEEPEDGLPYPKKLKWDGRLWACPFSKHDPQRYSIWNTDPSEKDYRNCSKGVFRWLSSVKTHIQKCHRKPNNLCLRCYEVVPDPVAHARGDPCTPGTPKFTERITQYQYENLLRKGPGDNESRESQEKRWFAMYSSLWSTAELPSSPYQTSTAAHLVRDFQAHYLRVQAEIINQSYGGGPEELRQLLEIAFVRGIEDLLGRNELLDGNQFEQPQQPVRVATRDPNPQLPEGTGPSVDSEYSQIDPSLQPREASLRGFSTTHLTNLPGPAPQSSSNLYLSQSQRAHLQGQAGERFRNPSPLQVRSEDVPLQEQNDSIRPPPQHFTLGRRTQLSNRTDAVCDMSSTQSGQPLEGFQFPLGTDMDGSSQPGHSNYFDDALLCMDDLSEIERFNEGTGPS